MTCEVCIHAEATGSWPQWLLNKSGTHCDGCHRTWTASREAHCVGVRADGMECHQHFSRDSVADKHREAGHCLTPEEMLGKRTKTGGNVLARTLTAGGEHLWRHPETLRLKSKPYFVEAQ